MLRVSGLTPSRVPGVQREPSPSPRKKNCISLLKSGINVRFFAFQADVGSLFPSTVRASELEARFTLCAFHNACILAGLRVAAVMGMSKVIIPQCVTVAKLLLLDHNQFLSISKVLQSDKSAVTLAAEHPNSILFSSPSLTGGAV